MIGARMVPKRKIDPSLDKVQSELKQRFSQFLLQQFFIEFQPMSAELGFPEDQLEKS